jgi:hypothetical protein
MRQFTGRRVPLVRRMSDRDPWEEHRGPTPLELLFDLTLVVAVARAALELREALAQGHPGHALESYVVVFFGVWWAWVNFTWFASAYDTDDVPYRLLTLLQMAGVLVLSAGIPAAFSHFDFVLVTVGYVVMRTALVAQWLRAARSHPQSPGRNAEVRGGHRCGRTGLGWQARPAGAGRDGRPCRAGRRRARGAGLGTVHRPGHALASRTHHPPVRSIHHHRARRGHIRDWHHPQRRGDQKASLARPCSPLRPPG